MKTCLSSVIAITFFLTATGVQASVMMDFDPSGEYADQFSGGSYTESATGGLSASVGVALSNLAPTTFDGTQSESFAPGNFTVGQQITVGAFFNLESLGTNTGADGQILRLGVTNGGADNFAFLPFSAIQVDNTSTGAARFIARQSIASAPNSFTLATDQWYYFETTFTRNTSTEISYDMLLASASGDGTIGTLLDSWSHASSADLRDTELDGGIYAGFKGHASDAVGVLDNFYVSAGGISQVPEPATASLACLGFFALIVRRRMA